MLSLESFGWVCTGKSVSKCIVKEREGSLLGLWLPVMRHWSVLNMASRPSWGQGEVASCTVPPHHTTKNSFMDVTVAWMWLEGLPLTQQIQRFLSRKYNHLWWKILSGVLWCLLRPGITIQKRGGDSGWLTNRKECRRNKKTLAGTFWENQYQQPHADFFEPQDSGQSGRS